MTVDQMNASLEIYKGCNIMMKAFACQHGYESEGALDIHYICMSGYASSNGSERFELPVDTPSIVQ